MALSLDVVRKVARLARLKLSEPELTRYQGQLGRILEHMDELKSIDTKDVAPTAHALGLTNAMREDVPAPASDIPAIMANFPEREGPYLKVPKVIE